MGGCMATCLVFQISCFVDDIRNVNYAKKRDCRNENFLTLSTK